MRLTAYALLWYVSIVLCSCAAASASAEALVKAMPPQPAACSGPDVPLREALWAQAEHMALGHSAGGQPGAGAWRALAAALRDRFAVGAMTALVDMAVRADR